MVSPSTRFAGNRPPSISGSTRSTTTRDGTPRPCCVSVPTSSITSSRGGGDKSPGRQRLEAAEEPWLSARRLGPRAQRGGECRRQVQGGAGRDALRVSLPVIGRDAQRPVVLRDDPTLVVDRTKPEGVGEEDHHVTRRAGEEIREVRLGEALRRCDELARQRLACMVGGEAGSEILRPLAHAPV